MEIRRVNISKLIQDIKPMIYTDGSMEYMIHAFLNGKCVFERCAFDSYGNMDKLKKDLSLTIKCAAPCGDTVKVNGVDIKQYIQ